MNDAKARDAERERAEFDALWKAKLAPESEEARVLFVYHHERLKARVLEPGTPTTDMNETPEQLAELNGDFYNGIEWFACWLLDHVERETITEEQLRPWAAEAWREHLEQHPDKQSAMRAEFEKLWQEKLLPILVGAYPRPLEVELMRAAHLCWLAFKEGRCPSKWNETRLRATETRLSLKSPRNSSKRQPKP